MLYGLLFLTVLHTKLTYLVVLKVNKVYKVLLDLLGHRDLKVIVENKANKDLLVHKVYVVSKVNLV